MPTIDLTSPASQYPEQAFWEAVTLTLINVFNQTPLEADQLVQALRSALHRMTSADRLLLCHSEPLDVAADLAGSVPADDQQVDAYRKLGASKGWWVP
jgi:hypothetical protein